MAHERDESLYPSGIAQNPAPVEVAGQESIRIKQDRVDAIMREFLRVLPSNYVAQVTGPYYTTQFQAIAEALVCVEMELQRVAEDSDVDFTRPEFLWKIIGSLVFPDAENDGEAPQLDGDVVYRAFLKNMVLLLIQGSGVLSIGEGVELLTDADVEVIERVIHARTHPTSGWDVSNQHEIEVNISVGENKDGIVSDPLLLQRNVEIVLQALKPAHTLIVYRNLIQETFGPVFSDSVSWNLGLYYYEDARRFCDGTKELTGTAGETLSNTLLFSDPSRDFRHIAPGAVLTIDSGPNKGSYVVAEVLTFPGGDDATERDFTLSPSGDTGTGTVSGDTVTQTGDAADDFNTTTITEGELITFASGPNAGTYRLHKYLGVDTGGTTSGGLILDLEGAGVFFEDVEVAPSILRLRTRMKVAQTGQSYSISVDRLGVKTINTVTAEDVSSQFYS